MSSDKEPFQARDQKANALLAIIDAFAHSGNRMMERRPVLRQVGATLKPTEAINGHWLGPEEGIAIDYEMRQVWYNSPHLEEMARGLAAELQRVDSTFIAVPYDIKPTQDPAQ